MKDIIEYKGKKYDVVGLRKADNGVSPYNCAYDMEIALKEHKEEDKKIEKIKISYEDDTYKLLLDDEDAEDGQREILACKLNELIDEVNKLKED